MLHIFTHFHFQVADWDKFSRILTNKESFLEGCWWYNKHNTYSYNVYCQIYLLYNNTSNVGFSIICNLACRTVPNPQIWRMVVSIQQDTQHPFWDIFETLEDSRLYQKIHIKTLTRVRAVEVKSKVSTIRLIMCAYNHSPLECWTYSCISLFRNVIW